MKLLRIVWQWAGMVALLCAIGLGAYFYTEHKTFETQVTLLSEELSETKLTLEQFVQSTRERIESTEQRHSALNDILINEQKRIDDIADNVEGVDRSIGKLSGSVETLEKLTTTDPQLLQKYSKIYFLNEHYIPGDLTVIEEKYDLVNGKEVSVHAEMWPFLKDLLDDAWDEGVDIMVLSGYRSFAEQETLKRGYTQQYGAGANQFSADQGYSEHQLGTTVDFTDKSIGENIDQFATQKAFAWLKDNAYKYGFIMSYPENNAHYMYEPWHWRFVGKDLARYLNKNNLNFYDVEQRKIDEYLAVLFDK